VFAVQALIAVALLAGYRTRAATFATAFLTLSLQIRNPHVIQGGDGLLRILLFWAIFLPLGACWSLDARREPAPPPKRILSAATGGLILQMCFLYWFSVILKSDPAWHEEGTAVYLALSLDQMVKPAGLFLLDYPELCRFLTWATYGLELIGPALLFVPVFRWQLRLAVVAAFLAFHLVGLNLCMELGPFPYVCAAGWVALLPSQFWDRLAAWRGRVPRFGPGFATAPPAWNVMAASLLIYVLLWNVRTVAPRVPNVLPAVLNPVGFAFGLDQFWGMFSPRPPLEDGWFVIRGTLNDGEEVDLFRGGRPLTWEKPRRVADDYPNERWRKFMMNLPGPGQDENRSNLIRFFWDRWNREHTGGRQLRELKLYFVLEVTLPDNKTKPPEPLLLGYCALEHRKSKVSRLPGPEGEILSP
jgi:hypothetical protein